MEDPDDRVSELRYRKKVLSYIRNGKSGPCKCEDARLFHMLEILGMFASYRVLLSKLKIAKASHARPGVVLGCSDPNPRGFNLLLFLGS